LPGVGLAGSGTIADMLWASPALTVTGIDIPPVIGSTPAIQSQVRAKINLRLPHGTDAAEASRALAAQLRRVAPWNVEVDIAELSRSQPFRSPAGGPGYASLAAAMHDAFGRAPVRAGLGGSMPTCHALAETYPEAEIVLLGVEEPRCLIHAPNESVNPSEIEKTALALALFLTGDPKGDTADK
jgi:acetylornithine deacetylase/succinyl-diaminopimelate desuccinylase-like protein